MSKARFHYDTAFALSQGGRDYQEDCLLSAFGGGAAQGFAVLADGMGGQAAGDVASQLVAYEVAFDLQNRLRDGPGAETGLPASLRGMADRANETIADNVEHNPDREGMGATLLATVMFQNRLYWVSVGDSPLYLYRDGALRQINEDHSMAPIIAKMVEDGELDPEAALNHPNRNALTSVLMGGKVKLKNAPETATELQQGDVVIAASDGLQFLSDAMIAEVLAEQAGASSQQICTALMQALEALDDPDQDNIAILVLQLARQTDTPPPPRGRPQQITRERPKAAAAAVRSVETFMPEPDPEQIKQAAPQPAAPAGQATPSKLPLALIAGVIVAALVVLVLAYLYIFGRPAPGRMQMSEYPVTSERTSASAGRETDKYLGYDQNRSMSSGR
ncbi:PP2C family protein-serine/threonine phosphatase [Pseudosulfitobacter pseudonitzschiae]|uniref:PP2C family protein-serine/threonine phosphatase n=1 Tax=Pseudosulfitobacter pseudonitzschiae TaxID=1402135 RepID=UPI001AF9ADD6|nr:protein phosphatase 2C domain-containing protein [Pseudosulfitobacter pseudonitzschiae]MBM1814798.1 serine/threonine-protein phosphatase [Pseudosulfitobacter pseudonitzschiae]MBM1831792.1 serine/threonine-protein phosphatase [Pseudosulfitobacter pseudonitzschiae]MBM1836657.1 serine/threonine-protein phosphatase [Pseudosulfitobacter pseudonitzschiae]MBM1841504.1 serine/threonine-protein phosphatase [Pseudosulfitobacter pseudonitzschiae]MBM1846371.1 serine/threonine-protein phosphatase [Pseud